MARTSAKAKKQRQEANRNRDKVEEPAEALPSDNQENIENGAQKEKSSRKTISKTEESEQEYDNNYENDVSDSEKKGKKRVKVENSKRKEKKVKREKSESREADEGEAPIDAKDYEVEKIVEVHHKKNGKREFLIRWKGFTSKDDTWEPEENLSCPELINRFMAKVDKAKNVTVRELREQRPRTQRFTPTVPGVRTSQRNQGKARTVFYTE